MKTEELETFTVTVPAGALLYPAVYAALPWPDGPRYGVTFPADRLPGDRLKGLRTREREDGAVTASAGSRSRVEVSAQWWGRGPCHPGLPLALDELVTVLRRLDARNLPRDRVFLARRTLLELSPYDYDHPIGRTGFHRVPTLLLRKVTVCLADPYAHERIKR